MSSDIRAAQIPAQGIYFQPRNTRTTRKQNLPLLGGERAGLPAVLSAGGPAKVEGQRRSRMAGVSHGRRPLVEHTQYIRQELNERIFFRPCGTCLVLFDALPGAKAPGYFQRRRGLLNSFPGPLVLGLGGGFAKERIHAVGWSRRKTFLGLIIGDFPPA